jgi:hypothetical protein
LTRLFFPGRPSFKFTKEDLKDEIRNSSSEREFVGDR